MPFWVTTPLDVYSACVTDEVIDLIVTETNRFALQELGGQESEHGRTSKWVPTTNEEIKRYLGVCIVMGLSKHPDVDSYWSKSDIYGIPLIERAMS